MNFINLQQTRFRLLFLVFVIFLIISFFSRTVLLLGDINNIDLDFISLLKVYSVGFIYDFVASTYYVIPLVIYLVFIPNKIFNSKIHKNIFLALMFVFNYSLIFNGVSEWFFWEEFGKRFNFIAVDYLVYTHEVIHNILESYPIPLLVSVILIVNTLLFILIYKKVSFVSDFNFQDNFVQRVKIGALLLLLPIIFFIAFSKQDLSQVSTNMYNNELAKNGFYSLFSAFRNNTLDYDEYYETEDIKKVMKNLKQLTGFDDTRKKVITSSKNEKTYNVVLIMVESLSASYMGIYGDEKGWTPNLDKLAKKSLFFDNLYATGTRTVRGMEAVTLSTLPTAGRSIVKRPDNHNMYSTGFIFKEKEYKNKFIYAGYGYFDNMNEFFSNNGFDIIDRTNFEENEMSFANAWGVCDEDLLAKTLKESDKSYANKEHFFNFVMTTSNHRPYTYPDNKIDIPSHSGRAGGVKYTDYAINKFLTEAEKKPWFKDTLFVIVADHNGGSAGKNSLPAWRYKIPFMVYAPYIIKADTVSKLSSQIDIMPTLFSLMGWNYESLFYGNDILSNDFKQRAFIGNYQKLGLLQNNQLLVLTPDKNLHKYNILEETLSSIKYQEDYNISEQDKLDIITYYQSASYFYKHNINRWNFDR